MLTVEQCWESTKQVLQQGMGMDLETQYIPVFPFWLSTTAWLEGGASWGSGSAPREQVIGQGETTSS